MKSSTILKKARKLIESGKDDYVCCAVESVSKNDKSKGEKIIKFISGSILPHYTLGHWIEGQIHRNIYDDPEYNQRIRQTRLNWIDHMIDLYKAKGD
jgi:hypothetical protein